MSNPLGVIQRLSDNCFAGLEIALAHDGDTAKRAVAALVEVAREIAAYPTAGAYPDGPCLRADHMAALDAALAPFAEAA